MSKRKGYGGGRDNFVNPDDIFTDEEDGDNGGKKAKTGRKAGGSGGSPVKTKEVARTRPTNNQLL
jgi:hypothetical protein